MTEEILKAKIEASIKETLVIKNPESIWRAVEKIIKIYDTNKHNSIRSL